MSTDDAANRTEEVLTGLDAIIDRAYFVPVGPGDALAVQLRQPALRGLDIETVAGVLAMVDRLSASGLLDQDDPEAAAQAAGRFFSTLAEEFPAVYGLWSQADPSVVVDPEAGFRNVLARSEESIRFHLNSHADGLSPAQISSERKRAAADIMSRVDLEQCRDDMALRQWLRQSELALQPAWLQPALYVDCWADYVRAVMDLGPSPELEARWPF